MYKKQIGHVVMVSLNYFFNVDYSFCKQIVSVVLLLKGIVGLLMMGIADYFVNGVETVKGDMLAFKSNLAELKPALIEVRETLVNSARNLKSNLLERELTNQ